MDMSDGLVGDLGKLCSASQVTAIVEASRVPLSDAVARAVADNRFDLASCLTGGDDYEILCAVPRDQLEGFAGRRSRGACRLASSACSNRAVSRRTLSMRPAGK